MSLSFDPDEGLVIVRARLWGPRGRAVVRLALDTGATATLVNWDIAVLLGYDPSATPTREQITTGSGVEFAPEIPLDRIEALGMERMRFPVLCHTLPPSAGVALDFRTGAITVD